MIEYKVMTANELAVEDAQKDALFYGAGWLCVDRDGNLTRVSPIRVYVTPLPESDTDETSN